MIRVVQWSSLISTAAEGCWYCQTSQWAMLDCTGVAREGRRTLMEQASCLEQVRIIDCEFIHTKNNVCPCGPTISVLPPIRTLISCVCATRAVHHLMPPQIMSLCSETVSLCELQVCSVNWQKTLCYHSVPESLYARLATESP